MHRAILCLLLTPAAFADADLDAARGQLRAAGGVVTAAALAERLSDVPADLDAASAYAAAMDAVPSGEADAAWQRLVDARRNGLIPPLDGEPAANRDVTWQQVADVLADADDGLMKLEEVDGKIRPKVERVRADFGLNFADPPGGLVANVMMPRLAEGRNLMVLLSWQLFEAVHAGRHDEVGPIALRMLGLADATEAGHPVLIGHLVAIGHDALTADTLQRVTPHLKIGDAPGELSPGAVSALIEVLLDDEADADAWRAAIDGEAVMQQNAVDFLLGGGDPAIFADVFDLGNATPAQIRSLRGDAGRSGVLMAELMLIARDAVQAGAVDVEPLRRKMVAAGQDAPALAQVMVPALDRTALTHAFARNQRRLAAVALAMASYRSAEGELPPTLAALVPEHLPEVPTDALTDAPIGYDTSRGTLSTSGPDGSDQIVRLRSN